MYVETVSESEARITLETLLELANGLLDGEMDARSILDAAGFSRAAGASEASLQRLRQRLASMLDFLTRLPDLDTDQAAAQVSEALTEIPIAPLIVDHGGIGHHIHWTPSTATFDDQAMADMLMALAWEVCDNGTIRFGRCAADDCDEKFGVTVNEDALRKIEIELPEGPGPGV